MLIIIICKTLHFFPLCPCGKAYIAHLEKYQIQRLGRYGQNEQLQVNHIIILCAADE